MRICSAAFCVVAFNLITGNHASAQTTQSIDLKSRKYAFKRDWTVNDALKHLSDESGLKLSGRPAPKATLLASWPSNEAPLLTFNEAFDFLNEYLQTEHKCCIIRREKSLVVVYADDNYPFLTPRITVAELHDRAKTEYVEMLLYLRKGVNADEKVPQLKRILGDFSRVVVIHPDVNVMIVQANVRNLQLAQFIWKEWLATPDIIAQPPIAMPCPCPPPCPPRRLLFPRLRLR